jgi:hypothetical protein
MLHTQHAAPAAHLWADTVTWRWQPDTRETLLGPLGHLGYHVLVPALFVALPVECLQ